MTQAIAPRKATRRKMVRKQVYILPHQELQLKAIAEEQLVSEAELIRQAVAAFLARPLPNAARQLPPDEAAWQVILASFEVVRQQPVGAAPHRWTRDEYYDDPRQRQVGPE